LLVLRLLSLRFLVLQFPDSSFWDRALWLSGSAFGTARTGEFAQQPLVGANDCNFAELSVYAGEEKLSRKFTKKLVMGAKHLRRCRTAWADGRGFPQ
jgi:hypothetical protein